MCPDALPGMVEGQPTRELITRMKAADVAGNSTRMVEGQPTREFMTRVKAVDMSGYSTEMVEGEPTREFNHSGVCSRCVRILHRDGGRTADT